MPTLMTLPEVYRNLCWYDPRHPDYILQDHGPADVPRDDCSCDNCFYGRDPLAMEILMLRRLLLGEQN